MRVRSARNESNNPKQKWRSRKKTKKSKASKKRTKKTTAEEEEDDDELLLIDEDEEDDEDEGEDLDEIEDDMLSHDDDGPARTPDAVQLMLWEVECPGCDGSKPGCKVRRDFGCPPGIED